jgi:hypothetical protein
MSVSDKVTLSGPGAYIARLERDLASMRASRDALALAAEAVISHMDGRQPVRGWLRDNDSSRDALSMLIAALAAKGEAS